MKTSSCFVVTVEGPDAVGKATQSKMLVDALNNATWDDDAPEDCRAVRIEIPSKQASWTHTLIYSMLRSGWAKRLPNSFQVIQFVNKLSFQLRFLPRYLRENDYVVLDRWSLSGYVYGTAEAVWPVLGKFFFERLVKPDLTIVLSGSSFKRPRENDSYEKDDALQRLVSNLYMQFGAVLSDHAVISNAGTIDEVHERILSAVIEKEAE